jgi:hypothetical protein
MRATLATHAAPAAAHPRAPPRDATLDLINQLKRQHAQVARLSRRPFLLGLNAIRSDKQKKNSREV